MNQVHYLIDVNKIDCGKVDRRTLPTFPQSLLILRSFIPKTGHLYFAEKGTFLLCLDSVIVQGALLRVFALSAVCELFPQQANRMPISGGLSI